MNHNITITRGDTWTGFSELEVLINDVVPESSIAGALMKLRRSPGARDVAMIFTTENDSILIRDGADNILEIPARLMDLAAGVYHYDLDVTFADGRVLTILSGGFHLTPDTSRP